MSQLLAYHGKLHHLAEGNNLNMVILGFVKAFEKVDHNLLLDKIKDLGIAGKIGLWLFNFLMEQKQTVSANGAQCHEWHYPRAPYFSYNDREHG